MNGNWKKTYQPIEINNLNLDLSNPRTKTGSKQKLDDVVEELLDENIVDLVESIAIKGYAAVSVSMVVCENGKNVVIDGNRRLLAVKILNEPDKFKRFVPSVISNSDFERIKQLSKIKKEEILNLTAVVYPSRKDAEEEMSILHLDGEAVKKWKPLRQYRYFQDRLLKQKSTLFDLSESLGIKSERIKKGLTTIQLFNYAKDNIDLGNLNERVYNDKDFRTDKFQKTVINEEGERFLGYVFHQEKCILVINNEETFQKKLKKVLLEIYKDDSIFFASAQYPTVNRSKFFKTLDPSFLNSQEYSYEQKKLQGGLQSGQSSFLEPPLSIVQKTERSDRKPFGLFTSSVVPFKLKNSSLRLLYDELKNIDVKSFPNATHDLLRTFLECSLAEYLEQIGEYTNVKKSDQHRPKLSEMLTHVISSKIIKNEDVLDNLKDIKTNWNESYSLERMNKINHNKDYASNESDVRTAWSKLESFFKVILNPKIIKK